MHEKGASTADPSSSETGRGHQGPRQSWLALPAGEHLEKLRPWRRAVICSDWQLESSGRACPPLLFWGEEWLGTSKALWSPVKRRFIDVVIPKSYFNFSWPALLSSKGTL